MTTLTARTWLFFSDSLPPRGQPEPTLGLARARVVSETRRRRNVAQERRKRGRQCRRQQQQPQQQQRHQQRRLLGGRASQNPDTKEICQLREPDQRRRKFLPLAETFQRVTRPDIFRQTQKPKH